VKLQYFETDRLMSKSAKLAAYQKAAGETDPIAMLRRLELRIEEMGPIVDRAHALGMHAIVTVFSTELVELAERLKWDAYKTASPDIVHRPLLEKLMGTGKPVIVSTGAATLDEVRRAVKWIVAGYERLAVLQCVSSYPTPRETAGLGGIVALQESMRVPVGYSDHTAMVETGAEAVALGACVLEKHMTYSKGAMGPDHAASLEPKEYGEYVRLARAASRREAAMGVTAAKVVQQIEADVRRVSRQSVVAVRAMAVGEVVKAVDVTIKRPGTGFLPFEMEMVVGKKVVRAVEADTVIERADIAST
jgi:N-acetylneuraminate synthase/N,N'-diacetyllegionaminate synthase